MEAASNESLQPKLEEAKRALEQALDVACSPDLDEIDTGEMIRLEEALVLASAAAKDVVSLRLRRRNERARLGKQGVSGEGSHAPGETSHHRVFDDIRGTRWQAFAVYPEQANTEPGALPEAYRQGWLAFKSERELRRLAPIPVNWTELSIEHLRELVHKAGVAKRTH